MSDIVLNPIGSGYNLSKFNTNFQALEDKINDEILHLTGGNNLMEQNLDMNSNRILNLPQPISDAEPVRRKEFQELKTGAIVSENVGTLDDILALANVNADDLVDGQQFYRGEFWPGTGVGAVNIKWDPNEPVANHNGGTIIDPAKISELNTTTKAFGTYFTPDTVSGDTGCFVVSQRWHEPYLFGCLGDGSTDDTAPLAACLVVGGDIRPSEGVYLIDRDGVDSGGVAVDLAENTKVTCHPDAVFKAGDLDNDMIRLWIPDNYSGPKLRVEWSGGVIDQRLQRNSTSVPFSANYPPANQGSSATTDGLSIVGIYDDSGTTKQGIEKCSVHGVKFIASDESWESAGGDSGLNIAAESDTAYDNEFFGHRDLGIYHSSDSVGGVGLGLARSFRAWGNRFYRNMFGVTSKRGADRVEIFGNTFDKCIQAIAAEPFDKRSQSWSVGPNVVDGYIFGIDIGSVDGLSMTGNVLTNAGVLLEDGTVPTANFTSPTAIQLKGVVGGAIVGNTISGKIPEFSGNSCDGFELESQDLGSGAVDTDDCLINNNTILNIDDPVVSANLLNNTFDFNKVKGTNDDNWDRAHMRSVMRNGGELTISAGAITVTNSFHSVDTEADAASDDLDTINGGVENMRLTLKPNRSDHAVTLRDGTGNLALAGDFVMNGQEDYIELAYNTERAAFWYEISRSNN